MHTYGDICDNAMENIDLPKNSKSVNRKCEE